MFIGWVNTNSILSLCTIGVMVTLQVQIFCEMWGVKVGFKSLKEGNLYTYILRLIRVEFLFCI